jgi:hypothetical protein
VATQDRAMIVDKRLGITVEAWYNIFAFWQAAASWAPSRYNLRTWLGRDFPKSANEASPSQSQIGGKYGGVLHPGVDAAVPSF